MKFIIQNKIRLGKNDFIQLVNNDGSWITNEFNCNEFSIVDLKNVVELTIFESGCLVVTISQKVIQKIKITGRSVVASGRFSILFNQAGTFYEICVTKRGGEYL